MISYAYNTVNVNGRVVNIQHIINGKEQARSPHENVSFQFIRRWFSGDEVFELETSGSTGQPKKIQITRDQMVASARLTAEALDLKEGQTALACIDTQYIGGRMMLVRSFVCNLKLILIDPTSNPLEKIDHSWIDFTAMVPLQISTILSSEHSVKLNNISTIIIGGAPLDDVTILLLDKYSVACFATYGMTETISHIALKQLNRSGKQPYYQTLPSIIIGTDHRQCLYADVPYLTERVQTNDVVTLHSDRQFTWLGRIDNVINSGGIKIMAEKIEKQLLPIFIKHDLLSPFFITGIPDERLGEHVTIVLETPSIPDVSFLRNSVAEIFATFPRYEAPKTFSFVKSFVRTETGKVNRVKTLEHIFFTLHLRDIVDSH